jgi:hypothetical protein
VRGACLLAAWLAASAAQAETVYRCGPDGNQYAAVPCAEGRELQVGDDRTPAQRKAAESAARRDAELAERLRRERERREAALHPAVAGGIHGERGMAPAPAASSASHTKNKKSGKKKPVSKSATLAAATPR